jgi:hypothetical protein
MISIALSLCVVQPTCRQLSMLMLAMMCSGIQRNPHKHIHSLCTRSRPTAHAAPLPSGTTPMMMAMMTMAEDGTVMEVGP